MFCDITTLIVKAWNWWDWALVARRVKGNPKGWPIWWDWGRGWSIIFKVNHHINTLSHLHSRKYFEAKSGEKWARDYKHWADAEDLILEVPLWTVITVTETWEIYDLSEKWMEITVQEWGRWGYWNAHFTSSIRQYPDFCEKWEPINELELKLELKLVADIWIIWIPSAWKSTLISKITNLKAKIWDYPFTTLKPNLWIVNYHGKSMTVSDIPWIIEWASKWKGLWTDFLRHISRNLVLIHLIDCNADDIYCNYKVIQKEIKLYDKFSSESKLTTKKQIVVLNKIDLVDEDCLKMLIEEFLTKCKKHRIKVDKKEIFTISCFSWDGIDKLLTRCFELIESQKEPEVPQSIAKRIIYRPVFEEDPRYFKAEKIKWKSLKWGKLFLITWRRIVQIAKMTHFEQKWWIDRLYDVLKKLWIQEELRSLWADIRDEIVFGDLETRLAFKET